MSPSGLARAVRPSLCQPGRRRPAARHTPNALIAAPNPEVASNQMGYKILGYAVWHGSRLYVRRRVGGTKGKAAILGAGVLVLAGVALAGRQPTSSQ